MPAVLAFSTIDWHYLWNRPQAVMSRLARDGWPVLYVDTLGLRSPRPRDLPRILARVRRRFADRSGRQFEPVPRVRVCSPLLLPFLNSRLACWLNVRYLAPRLRRQVEQLGGGVPVIWVYLPTWTVLQCVRAIPHALLVYEAIDALADNPAGVGRGFQAAEREILARADLVIASSESLFEEKALHRSSVHWVPSGVAENFFAAQPAPADLRGIPAPRIGFFGTLDHRLDLVLMEKLAAERPQWSFVLLGPARSDLSRLTALSNVHWLGPRRHGELPGYLAGLDAIYLPYVLDDFTRHIYPAKLHECLALGKPVVATALPSLKPFAGLVRLVEPGQGFAGPLQAALVEDDSQMRARRVALARENSWEVRYRQIRRLAEEALAGKQVEDGRGA